MGLTRFLRRGLVAGVAAGVASALVSWLLVEPLLRQALVIEEARGGSHYAGMDEPRVSRSLQVVGGAATSVVVAALFGVVFAVVFTKVRHRLPGEGNFVRSAGLAGVGFFVFTLVPALKIPANPPGVGDPATVSERTLIYASSILLGLLLVLAVAVLNRYLCAVSAPTRYTLDAGAVVAGVALILMLVPASPDTVPGDVPASLLWDFRLASLAQLAAMWGVLGMIFGMLVEPRDSRQQVVAPAAS